MSKLKTSLAALGEKPALMTHVVLGYPDLETSKALVKTMADAGASFIELQIPFSDPMADGPSIMRASEAALEQGVTPKDCMKAMEELASTVEIPLLFMSYYNIVFKYGADKFAKDTLNAGGTAAIIPDIPFEESGDGFFEAFSKNNLPAIPLVSPVTPDSRLEAISKNTSDEAFVYCVATTGTTGARDDLPEDLGAYLQRVKKHFNIPRAVGFGISKPAHVKALAGHAEIAVCGSAVINEIDAAIKAKENPQTKVKTFISGLLS